MKNLPPEYPRSHHQKDHPPRLQIQIQTPMTLTHSLSQERKLDRKSRKDRLNVDTDRNRQVKVMMVVE